MNIYLKTIDERCILLKLFITKLRNSRGKQMWTIFCSERASFYGLARRSMNILLSKKKKILEENWNSSFNFSIAYQKKNILMCKLSKLYHLIFFGIASKLKDFWRYFFCYKWHESYHNVYFVLQFKCHVSYHWYHV